MHLRLRSNVLAFHDLGWQVEVVLLGNEGTAPEWAKIPGLDWTIEPFNKSSTHFLAGVLGKLEYRLGYPGEAACRYMFQKHDAVREAVAKRSGQGNLHFFEGLPIANALPFLGGDKVIFSHHDIWHEGNLSTMQAHHEIEKRSLQKHEVRQLRFLKRIEARLCQKSDSVLTISARDCNTLRGEGWENIDYLPMSVDESEPMRRAAPDDGFFRILHLGRIGHLPSYRSLEFLLQDVFPLLGQETLSKIRMRVVGKAESDNPLVKRILKLREHFVAQVELVGYVSNISDEFAGNDVQVVVPTAASGLQTRIVESFARGLPVIATEMAARGLEDPCNRRDLLIVKTAQEVADVITEIAPNKSVLNELVNGGLEYYERRHSRKHVAERLRLHLSRLNPT